MRKRKRTEPCPHNSTFIPSSPQTQATPGQWDREPSEKPQLGVLVELNGLTSKTKRRETRRAQHPGRNGRACSPLSRKDILTAEGTVQQHSSWSSLERDSKRAGEEGRAARESPFSARRLSQDKTLFQAFVRPTSRQSGN